MRVFRTLALLSLAAACGRNAPELVSTGCQDDFDCRGSRVCVLQRCEEPRTTTIGGRDAGPSGAGAHSGSMATGGGASSGGRISGGAAGGPGAIAAGAASGGAAMEGVSVRRVDVDASAIAADRARHRIYAVVLGKAAAHANDLVEIDADAATVEASVTIGSDPMLLAISDDASRLWVALHGALSIREVDLTVWPPTPGSQYPLPKDAFGETHSPARMLVLPGEPASVAISMKYEFGVVSGTVVLDSGIPRPNRLDGSPGASRLITGPPGYLFGFNDGDTGFDFLSIAVDTQGLTQRVRGGLIDGFDTDIAYDEGMLVASSGQVLDVSDPDSVTRAGTFPFAGLVVPHVAESKAVMLSYAQDRRTLDDSSELVVRELNLETFLQERERSVPGKYELIQDLVEIEPGQFAFRESPDGFGSNPNAPSRVHLLTAP